MIIDGKELIIILFPEVTFLPSSWRVLQYPTMPSFLLWPLSDFRCLLKSVCVLHGGSDGRFKAHRTGGRVWTAPVAAGAAGRDSHRTRGRSRVPVEQEPEPGSGPKPRQRAVEWAQWGEENSRRQRTGQHGNHFIDMYTCRVINRLIVLADKSTRVVC